MIPDSLPTSQFIAPLLNKPRCRVFLYHSR